MEWRMNTTTKAGQYQDTKIDVKLVLSALWIAMLMVFAYVDIFGFLRADILRAALDGKMAATGITVDQMFLVFTTVYILIPTLMVFLALVLQVSLFDQRSSYYAKVFKPPLPVTLAPGEPALAGSR
jgi:hypothetical protein